MVLADACEELNDWTGLRRAANRLLGLTRDDGMNAAVRSPIAARAALQTGDRTRFEADLATLEQDRSRAARRLVTDLRALGTRLAMLG
jgi:hypothetical protein